MLSLRTGKIVFLGAVCGLLIAAVNVSTLITERQSALAAAAGCDICGLANRAELEFTRVEQKIAAAVLPRSTAGTASAELRFDLLTDRAAALQGSVFGEFTRVDPASAETVGRLLVVIDALRPLIDHVEEPRVGEAALSLMAPLDFDLSRLAIAAERFGNARVAEGEAELVRFHRIFSSVVIALFAFGGALLLLVGWHNRQLGLARDRLQGLAQDLRHASAGLEEASSEVHGVNAQLQARNEILRRRDREMSVHTARFDAALNNMSQGLCMVDAAERLVICNQRFAELFALDMAPIPGIPFADVVALASNPHLQLVYDRQRSPDDESRRKSFVQDLTNRTTLSVSHQPTPEGGWVATYEDITSRREAEDRITYLAHHDALTGLVNRTFFCEQLTAMLATPMRIGRRILVHTLDIDGFKDFNESHGHPIGNALLREVGRRLSAAARNGDVVARLGGDEFAVLEACPPSDNDDHPIARDLVRALRDPFEIEGSSVTVTLSIGVATAPTDGTTADELMKNADLALYQAKLDGGDTCRVFERDMDAARRARRAIEADLRKALANDEFEVFFQPLVDARSVAITGYEALLRWRHPVRGMVSPGIFIPVAEDIGIISDLGEWVLREACRQATRWPGELTVAVNLSPAQFRSKTLAETVKDALVCSGLRPTRLELEITESVLLSDGDGTLATLHDLRHHGIRIAMDDFGTGYASLSYLRRFPFDKIKIDQSFVRELASRPDCIKIVRSITALGASLGMTTTAEGVETAEQFEQLQAAGCDQVQGYHFGRPQPVQSMLFALGPEFLSNRAAA